LPAALEAAAMAGPAVILFGLAPRVAEAALPDILEEIAL
jgi:hypothetical protein